MLSAFAVYYVSVAWGMPFWLGVAVAIAISAAVAVLCQKLLFKPLNYEILTCFIIGIGASFAIRSAAWAIFGPEPLAIPATIPGVVMFDGVVRREAAPVGGRAVRRARHRAGGVPALH